MQQIIDLDSTSITNLLKEEDAQTIALFSVTFLQPKARKSLMGLPERQREIVVEKLARSSPLPLR